MASRRQITYAHFELFPDSLHIALSIRGLPQRIEAICHSQDLLSLSGLSLPLLSLRSIHKYLKAQAYESLSQIIQFQNSQVVVEVGSARSSGKALSLKLPIVNGATVGVADERDRLDRVEARMEAMERLMRRERGEKKEDLAMMVSGLFLEMEKMKKERELTAQKMEEMTRSIREVEYMTEIIRTEPTNSFIQIPYERREQHEFESSLQIRQRPQSSYSSSSGGRSPANFSRMPKFYE